MTDLKLYADQAGAVPAIDQAVLDFQKQFEEENKRNPGGGTTEDYRLSLQLQYAPFGALLKRTMEIGNPEGLHTKAVQKRELDAILAELDRRFPQNA